MMNGRKWTDEEEEILILYFPHEPTDETCRRLNRRYGSVSQHAAIIGVSKTPEYMAEILALTNRNLLESGKAHRFNKGQEPPNKGKRMVDYMTSEAIERTKATRFKKGQAVHNHKPVGSERITVDGYVEVKIAEPHKWALKHRIEWKKVNGAIPKELILVTKDRKGDRTDCDPNKWELITRSENMKRNSYHNYGPEVAKAIQYIGALNRQINKRKKQEHEKH